MKKSIIIYADCIAILEELTYEQAGRLFKAVLSYVNEEPVTEIEGDPALKMAFVVLRKQIDRDTEKYEEICRKRKEIALAREQRKREARETTSVHKCEQKTTKRTYNDTENDSDSEVTKVTNKLPSSLRSEGLSHGKADATQPKSFREKVLLYFNERMAGKSIKPIKAITDGTKRSEYLKARVREHGRDAIFQMIDKAAGSKFLNGYNQKGFTATFDWLVLPNNFIKVLEGNYDNELNNGTANKRDNGAEQRAADAARNIASFIADDAD